MNSLEHTTHSPLPWGRDKYGHLADKDGEAVNFCDAGLSSGKRCKANDTLILAAVNAYDANQQTIEALRDALEEAREQLIALCSEDDVPSSVNAALALAKEQQ